MAKRLTRTVFVDGVAYGPASTIPEAVAVKITNPKVWTDADASAPAPAWVVSSGAPAGPAGADVPVPDGEATVKELRDYAKAKGITLGAAKAKPEILKALGLAEDEQGGEEADGTEMPEADSPEDVDESSDPDADGESAGDGSE